MNRCDRCGDEIPDGPPVDEPAWPFGALEGNASSPTGSPEDVRFCPLCLAELGMIGALDFLGE